jgi:hypothetical protein
MVARIVDCEVKMEKKDEFVMVLKNEILPLLKKQTGFRCFCHFSPTRCRMGK